MTHSVDPFIAIGAASMRVPEYTGAATLVYALYYLPLGALAYALQRWSPISAPDAANSEKRFRLRRIERISAVALVVLFCLIVFHPFSARRPDGRLRVDFLDVGQGDSILVTMPDGKTLLVDGGGRPRLDLARSSHETETIEAFERDARSIGEAVVSEYLWHCGLDRVDYVLATHADADHIDGLNDVLRNFRTKAAIVARTPANDAEFAQFAKSARRAGVPLYTVGRGDTMSFGDVEIEILWPPPVDCEKRLSPNDDSLVMRIRLGAKTILLTGDIERHAEAALVSTARVELQADVIKVAHHGSKTSSMHEFVEASAPGLAIISVGRDSPYGHPHAEVVARWRERGAQVLTTGDSGMISVSTNGEDLRVRTFVK